MSWKKQQIIEHAFEELGLAAYLYDLTADQLNSALYRLDAMMAMWVSKGIFLGYPAPSSPQDSNITDETNIPDWAIEAVILNFALKLAPSYGKVVSDQTKVSAKQAYDALLAMTSQTLTMQWPSSMPAGAGYRKRSFIQPFLPRPDTTPLAIGENGEGVFKNN